MIQTLFTVLTVPQFLFIVSHDLLDIPGWTHGRQVRAALGPFKTVVGTLINGLFPGLAVAFAFYYWHRPKPGFVLDYWVIYSGITIMGAITAWWIPYFRGTDEKTTQLYLKLYAGTRQVLPARGDNPRPNLLHLYAHALFLANLILATILWFGMRRSLVL